MIVLYLSSPEPTHLLSREDGTISALALERVPLANDKPLEVGGHGVCAYAVDSSEEKRKGGGEAPWESGISVISRVYYGEMGLSPTATITTGYSPSFLFTPFTMGQCRVAQV